MGFVPLLVMAFPSLLGCVREDGLSALWKTNRRRLLALVYNSTHRPASALKRFKVELETGDGGGEEV